MAKDAGMDPGVVQEVINQSKGVKRSREGSQGVEVKVKKVRKAKKETKVKDEM